MSTRSPRSDLTIVLSLLRIPRGRMLAAVGAASATLAASFALAAVSAWLVTKAWTMPPVLSLTVAVTSVRALGVSRGAFRWLDRMTTHDVALRGVVSLRTGLFTALARRSGDALSRLRRGDLLARIGDDAQEIGNHVINALVPALVSLVMLLLVTLTLLPLSVPAALAMLVSLLVAGLLGPWAALRASTLTEQAVVDTRSEVTARGMDLLDDATALRLQSRLDGELESLEQAQRDHDRALDRAAVPSALAAGTVPLVMIPALLASVLAAGQAWTDGVHGAGVIGILLLLPLSSFEAAQQLPAAAAQLGRSRATARRLVNDAGLRPDDNAAPITDAALAADTSETASSAEAVDTVPHLRVRGLDAGWSADRPRVRGLNLDLAPGARLAVIGPSGIGKSTLLTTLAGLLAPLEGHIEVDGAPLASLPPAARRARIVAYPEDAHVFATSVAENLRAARGDATDAEIRDALTAVGLDAWLEGLPEGVGTQLGGDGTTISGGERRRLLLARAVVRGAPISLLDEPTEHLDAALGDTLLEHLLTPGDGAVLPATSSAIVVTHHTEAIPPGTPVLAIAEDGSTTMTMRSPVP